MKLAIGCDHGGFLAKKALIDYLTKHYDVEISDFGCFSQESCNYPYYAFQAAECVKNGLAEKGILICNSGEGVCMCANKVEGIRCGIAYNDETSHLIVEHNEANMIAFGAKFMSVEDIIRRTVIFLESKPLKGKHSERVKLIEKYEKTKEILPK